MSQRQLHRQLSIEGIFFVVVGLHILCIVLAGLFAVSTGNRLGAAVAYWLLDKLPTVLGVGTVIVLLVRLLWNRFTGSRKVS